MVLIKNTLPFITIFLSLFPYLTPYSFGSDLQPWSLVLILFSSAVLLSSGRKVNNNLIYLFFVAFFALTLIFFSDSRFLFSSIRTLFGYFAIAFTPFVFLFLLEKHYRLFVFLLKFSVIVYFIYGFLQITFDSTFLNFLLNRSDGLIGGRGVTSLTTEPTFYGIVSFFTLLIFLTLDIKRKSFFIFLLLVQIFIIAKSSTAISFVFIYLSFFLIKKIKYLIPGVITLIIAFIFFSNNTGHEYRVLNIISTLVSNPEALLTDGSINYRLAAIYFSIQGFIDNYGLPNGLGYFYDYWTRVISEQEIFSNYPVSAPTRIMSFHGGILFELGLVGIIIPLIYTAIIFRAYKNDKILGFIYSAGFNIIMLFGVPVNLPLVGIYMAALIYKEQTEPNTES